MMQNPEYSKRNKVDELAVEKPNSSPSASNPPEKMTFDQLCKCMNNFFDTRDYESKQSYHKGFSYVVGEDYSNIDLLCNLNDIVYNYCNNENISKEEKLNLKNLTKGIQQITKSLEQYNINSTMDKRLISTLMGYILKITRNYFHDKH